jgi:cobalt/nickel transport system permease protein
VSGYHRGNFLERNIKGLHAAMDRAIYAEQSSDRGGLLQGIDPRVKVVGLIALIVAAALEARLWPLAAILALATALAMLSHITPWMLARRVWAGAFLFSGAIAIPALFLTPGREVWSGITETGLRTGAFLLLRVEASATLALLLVLTTPWMHVLKALRVLRVPVLLVVILGMTCRYILLLLEAAHEMLDARKSRMVGVLDRPTSRRMAVSAGGVLFQRTSQLSSDVYLAMLSRGFRGEVYLLDDFEMQTRDWAAAFAFAATAGLAIWAGRV